MAHEVALVGCSRLSRPAKIEAEHPFSLGLELVGTLLLLLTGYRIASAGAVVIVSCYYSDLL